MQPPPRSGANWYNSACRASAAAAALCIGWRGRNEGAKHCALTARQWEARRPETAEKTDARHVAPISACVFYQIDRLKSGFEASDRTVVPGHCALMGATRPRVGFSATSSRLGNSACCSALLKCTLPPKKVENFSNTVCLRWCSKARAQAAKPAGWHHRGMSGGGVTHMTDLILFHYWKRFADIACRFIGLSICHKWQHQQ